MPRDILALSRQRSVCETMWTLRRPEPLEHGLLCSEAQTVSATSATHLVSAGGVLRMQQLSWLAPSGASTARRHRVLRRHHGAPVPDLFRTGALFT